MQRTRGAISIFVAAMVIHAVAPAAAQTEPNSATFSTHSLSQALDEAWPSLRDSRAPAVRPEPQNPSLFKDVAGDYVRFFTARENYLILGVGLASSLSVKPLDQPIRESGFNTELWFNEGTALDHALKRGTSWAVRSSRWGARWRPTGSATGSGNRVWRSSDVIWCARSS